MRGGRVFLWALTLAAASSAWGVGDARAQGDPLRAYAQRRGLYVGAAVNMSPLGNETAYRETLGREYNVVVAENAFKFDATHPAQNTYNFTNTDALVAFAEANGMRVRGHTLVWHNQLPGWLTGGNFTRDEVIAILRDHVHTLVGRYRGRVWAWDVVNEAVADGSSSLRTNSFWFQKIGPDYIKLAFRFAQEADPDAVLYINDYGTEGLGAKSDGVYNLVRDLRRQGVPVHGVGWQAHFTHGFRVSPDHRANAERLRALGVEISITELDVRMPLPASPDKLATQATSYRELAEFCLSEPACVALLTWGFTDKYSWIDSFFPGQGAALPFDAAYQPKPAYDALRQALAAAASSQTSVQFDSGAYTAAEGQGLRQVTVTRTGDTGSAVAVDYAVTSGTASERADFTSARGTLRFAAGETSKTIDVLITDDAFVEPDETLNLSLGRPQGTNLGTPSAATLTLNSNDTNPSAPNPLEDPQFFVRQHYRDFLNREPDATGLAFWTDQMTNCGNPNPEVCRVNVSAAFFLSIEFQETGFLVYRLHKAAYGTGPLLRAQEFLPDTQETGRGVVVGTSGWEARLEQNKQAFVGAFVARPRFAAAYPQALTAAQFVDALNQNAGGVLSQSERDALAADLGGGAKSRADVLRAVAEDADLRRVEFDPAFVYMQYVGYLRREPSAPPDGDLAGFDFWLGKLNQFGGNFVAAEMVRAFLVSAEYRGRFGPQ